MARGKLYSRIEKNIIHQMKERGSTPTEIAAALKQQGFDRTNRQISAYLYDHAKGLPRVKPEMSEAYTAAIDQLEERRSKMIDVSRDHAVTIGQTTGDDVKVLILTDLHIPFELDEVIQHALHNHGDADVLVIGGDMFEAYCVSAFRKSKALLFRWELENALEYIKLFAGMFKMVLLLSGNHERRLLQYVTDNLGNMLRGLVQDDPMQILADGMGYGADGKLTKLYNFPNVIYDGHPRGDYIKIGQLIVAHPNNYSTIPMRTVINVAEGMLGLEDFQCIVMGHTHAQGRLIWRNRLLIEAGCCCMPLEYTFAQGRIAKLPQTYGYVVAHLDKEGNVNFDKTRAIYRGIGKVVKAETLSVGALGR